MEAEIPAASLRTFYRALQCLARIGNDISFEAQAQRLELIGINSSRSAYVSFTFQRRFFDSYEVAPAPGSQSSAAFRCRVLAKPLVGMFKSRGPKPGHAIEKCVLCIEQAADPVHVDGRQSAAAAAGAGAASSGECRLVVRMTYKEGICRTHRMFYETCETLHPVYNKDECKNMWRVGAKVAADWISHFARGQEEMSVWMSSSEVRVRSWAEGQFGDAGRTQIDAAVANTTRALQTELTVMPAEFDIYSVSGSRPTELTFGLREFKSILQYAEAVAQPLSAHFDKGGAPLLLSVGAPHSSGHDGHGMYSQAPNDVTADFVLATMTEYSLSQTSSSMTSSMARSAMASPESIHGASPHVGSFTPQQRLAAAAAASPGTIQSVGTPSRPMVCERVDEISVQSEDRHSGNGSVGQQSIGHESFGARLVQTPSPFQSSHASNNGQDLGINTEIDRTDSLLRMPGSASASSRGHGGEYHQTPVRNQGPNAGTTYLGRSSTTRSYRLLDMPRPQAPPGVTDSQQGGGNSVSDSADDEGGPAPPGMKQTRLPYQGGARLAGNLRQQDRTVYLGDSGGTELGWAMSSDDELDATPPPPSKRVRSLF
ncbi:hypothetical protein GGF46_002480 [Coemansia sp. RSA 552]|nr:hypothetical protein GGF46_002480 [Coemansia sp. RSA 552]